MERAIIILLSFFIGLLIGTFSLSLSEISKIEDKLDYQEVVNQKLYEDIHQLSNKADSTWVYNYETE